MKLSKKLEFGNSRNFNASTKEKLYNKTIQNNTINLFFKKKLFSSNNNPKKLKEKSDISPKGNNTTITVNNSINNIINKIKIISPNHSNEKSQKNITFNSYKYNISNNLFLTSKNSVNNLIALITKKNILRKRNSSNFFNHSLQFNTSINKIGRNPSLYKNKVTNAKMTIMNMYRRKRYTDLLSNNISSFNNSINSSINETIKNHKKFASSLNNFDKNSLRNKLFNAGKKRSKKKELNQKIKKAVLGINKVLPKKINLNNKKRTNLKSSLNNMNYLSINKNNTFANILDKKLKKSKNNSININTKININNNNPNYKLNMLNDNKKQNETLLKIIFKDEKNKPNIQIKKHSKENKNVEEKSKKIVTDKVTPKKENGSRLSETLLISKNATIIEDEGMLEIDDIKDIIIYYDLNKELNKDYLFEKFDYDFFIKKKMEKYFKFFKK